jgi:transcriptional regulator with XRE-family HTH domain
MEPIDRRALGRAIARFRWLEKGWSQRKLAREARCSPQSIRGLERGSRSTHPATIDRVLDVLHVTRESLLTPPPDPRVEGLNSEDLDIARLHQMAPTAMRALVRALLERHAEAAPEVPARWARIMGKLTTLATVDQTEILIAIERMVVNVGGRLPEVKPFARKNSI